MPKVKSKKEKVTKTTNTPVEVPVSDTGTCESYGCYKCANSNIEPITQDFGNGDVNTLRDKINEIIKTISAK